MSRNAITSSSSWTFAAGISPRTILQNRQFGSLIRPRLSPGACARPSRRCPRSPRGGAARRARPAAPGRGARAGSCSETTDRPPRAPAAAVRRLSPRAPSPWPPRRCAPESRRVQASFFPVDERRILQHRVRRHPPPVLEFAEKTALAPRMAGHAAHLLDLEQDRVGVAIQPDFDNFLRMAGLPALAPQAFARARPVDRLAAPDGLQERLAIHPRDGEDASGRAFLRDGRNQTLLVPRNGVDPFRHRRTSMPRARTSSFAWRTLYSPKWKMLAASTASARPSMTPSARCSSLPTPPPAITGTPTASATARVSARSNPSRVPSRSILVSRISPAPASCMRLAHATASRLVGCLPPCV